MSYRLGVDLGTTYTAAAVHKAGRSEVFELGTRSATIPSVVFIQDDGTILAGEAANRRALREPNRVARQFKRRVGDPTPMLVGGSPYAAEALSAKLLRWVVDTVAEREGSLPEQIALTHPANWGSYKLDLLQQALALESIEGVTLLPEPEAAAIEYASFERTESGRVVAVFDLGGGTFDASVLRKTSEGFEILGRPEGIERLGGVDFDEAVFGFVAQFLGDALTGLDRTDPVTQAAVARLRFECVEAKEALSFDTKVSIPVVLPTVHTEVRLTRSEFEDLIRPSLLNAVSAMKRAVAGAHLTVDDVDVVLLVGGSSRIPLIGQMVASDLGRPVAVDAHPKHLVALGASRPSAPAPKMAAAVPAPPPPPLPPPEPAPEPPEDERSDDVEVLAPTVSGAAAISAPPVDPPEIHIHSVDRSAPPKPRRRVLVLVASVALVAAVGLALALTRGDDSSQAATTASTEPSAEATVVDNSPATTTSTTVASTTTSSTTTTSQPQSDSAGETPLLSADSTSTTTSSSVAQTTTTAARPVTTARTETTAAVTTTQPLTTTTTATTTTTTAAPTTTTVATTTTSSPPTTQPQQAFVPGVAGLTGQQAVQRIAAAGLTSSCGQRCSDLVGGTSPPAGTALDPGTFVQLSYS
ncbi:MAG: Hsp70 family protein [Acidimicrobiales bacterium]|nr:Hsp70 family protein [Acidimicrobiales bacterium]